MRVKEDVIRLLGMSGWIHKKEKEREKNHNFFLPLTLLLFFPSGDLRSFLKIFPPGVIANTDAMMDEDPRS